MLPQGARKKAKIEKTAVQENNSWSMPSLETVYRGYNLLVASVVFLQYINNAEAAASEYLPDVAIHAFEAIAPHSLKWAGLMGNYARGVQAGVSFFSGDSTIPAVANSLDVINHGINLAWRAFH